MALKRFIVTKNYKAPYVRITNNPRMPQQICYVPFRRGKVIEGELKHVNDKPAFVLVKGTLPFPLTIVKELTTKKEEGESSASGSSEGGQKDALGSALAPAKTTRVRYLDALIIGGIVGAAFVYFAEKQGYFQPVEKKNKLYGAGIAALASLYLVYRSNQNKPKVQKD